MKELVKTLVREFQDKDYAQSYLDEFSNMEIAAQIKAIREQRGLTQRQLAELAGMKQERISALEDVNYSGWTASTLRKLANAFDVSLKISFETVSSRILDVDNLSKSTLERMSREDDLKKFADGDYQVGYETKAVVRTAYTSHKAITAVDVEAANDSWSNIRGGTISSSRPVSLVR